MDRRSIRGVKNEGARIAKTEAMRSYMDENGISIAQLATSEELASIRKGKARTAALREKLSKYDENNPIANKAIIQEETFEESIKATIAESLDAYLQPPVKSDYELQERIQAYFEKCYTRGSIPTWEEIVIYCGFTLTWAKRVMNGTSPGFSSRTRDILAKANGVLQAVDNKLALTNKVNPIVSIFRSKNYYGMADKVEHEHLIDSAPENSFSAQDIRDRYKDMGDVEESRNDSNSDGAG